MFWRGLQEPQMIDLIGRRISILRPHGVPDQVKAMYSLPNSDGVGSEHEGFQNKGKCWVLS